MANNRDLQDLLHMKMLVVAEKMQKTEEEFNDWFAAIGLLHRRQVCPRCHQDMTRSENKYWLCNLRYCRDGGSRIKKGYKVGTFFENQTLSPQKIFYLSYFWAHQYGTYEQINYETGIGHNAIVQ